VTLSLLLDGALPVYSPGIAVDTLVNLWYRPGVTIVAGNVLPRFTLLAQDGVSVVVGIVAYALECQLFFFFNGSI